MEKTDHLINILKNNRDFFARIIDVEFSDRNICVFDLTENNVDLCKIDLNSTDAFNEYIFGTLKKENKQIGVGGYMEDRLIYKRSKHFDNEGEPRSIHLGIDLWIDAETPVYSPLSGIVHSFKINNNFGDYGPTLVLEHLIEGVTFYTLYGHLSLDSIQDKKRGRQISRGEVFAKIGDESVNGSWPPHLHFQVITDMLGNEGDFPGVAPPSAKEYFHKLCVDPNLILRIEQLK